MARSFFILTWAKSAAGRRQLACELIENALDRFVLLTGSARPRREKTFVILESFRKIHVRKRAKKAS
jgi:hypothetical protein